MTTNWLEIWDSTSMMNDLVGPFAKELKIFFGYVFDYKSTDGENGESTF